MKFLVFSVYRKEHKRHLTGEELRLARAAAISLGSYNEILGNDGEAIGVHKLDVEADDQVKAMKLYKETHQGAEVFACEPAYV